MTPIHSILAATDLSPLARHAVVRAALVAAELGARLALQHVVNVGALDALRHLIDAGAADLQQKLLDEMRSHLPPEFFKEEDPSAFLYDPETGLPA